MAVTIKHKAKGSGRPRLITLTGVIGITAAGAVNASTTSADGYATVVKTATETGRYTVTLGKKYKSIRCLGAPAIEGPADTAMGNTDANAAVYRNVATQTFDIQLMLASSGADTETTSGNKIHWAVEVQD